MKNETKLGTKALGFRILLPKLVTRGMMMHTAMAVDLDYAFLSQQDLGGEPLY